MKPPTIINVRITASTRRQITQISKAFASGFDFEINGSGWLIVDPLSGFLNAMGHRNEIKEIPANEKHPQVLILEFYGGVFIPAGADLRPINPKTKNWMWIVPQKTKKA